MERSSVNSTLRNLGKGCSDRVLRLEGWIASVAVWWAAINHLHRNLLMESLLIWLGQLLRLRLLLLGMLGHGWRLNVCNRDRLLRSWLVHRDGVRAILLEGRFLRKRVRLWGREVAN